MNQEESIASGINPVTKGYKKTELGILPNDWDVSPISKNMKLINGFGFKPHQWSLYGLPIIRIQNLNSEKAKFNYFEGKVDDKFHVKKGDLLFAWSGSKGSSFGARVWVGIPAILNQHIFRVVPDTDVLTPKFSFYILRQVQEQIEKMAHGFKSSFVHVKKNDLSSTLLPIPSIKEQTAITNALSDVDALLRELDKLIAKKQAIKTASMQQLLTGKTRLPEYSYYAEDAPEGKRKGQLKSTKPSELGEIPEEWEVITIGDFAPLKRGFDLTNSDRREGKYPVVYSNGVVNHHDQFQVKGPGVVTGRSGTIGKVHYVEDNYWPHNTSLWVTSFEKADPKYVYYLYTAIGFNRFASGSGVPTLNRNDAHDFKIVTPKVKEEQTAIANILSDMDEEIQALKQRLTKTRQVKQSMMQELLTGKTRLPFEKADEQALKDLEL
jgi:type I restriction enzyme S subunit